MSGNVLYIVLKDDVSDVSVRFDEDTTLKLRWMFYSTSYDELSCKREMEEIILCE